jgi:hypothetical protein
MAREQIRCDKVSFMLDLTGARNRLIIDRSSGETLSRGSPELRKALQQTGDPTRALAMQAYLCDPEHLKTSSEIHASPSRSFAARIAPSPRIVLATARARAAVSEVSAEAIAADSDSIVGVGPSCAEPIPKSETRLAQ